MSRDLVQENLLLKEQIEALNERLKHQELASAAEQRKHALAIEEMQQRVASERELYEELMRMQDNLIAELSTPLLPVADRVLVMPIIGSIDQARVRRILEVLLKGVMEQRAHTVILDVSGIDRFHAVNADVLVRSSRAVRLLGAEVIITGVAAHHAASLLSLGVDLDNMTMRRELRAGIEYALKRRA